MFSYFKRFALPFQLAISILVGILLWLAFRHSETLAHVLIHLGIADYIVNSLQAMIHNTLLMFGIDNHCYGLNVCITGTRGMKLIFGCLGFSHMALFSGLVAAYSGKWYHKLWYIPSGVLFLHLLNALRLVIIGIVLKHAPNYDEQAHYWATRLIMYSGILSLWLLWIFKFSHPPLKAPRINNHNNQ